MLLSVSALGSWYHLLSQNVVLLEWEFSSKEICYYSIIQRERQKEYIDKLSMYIYFHMIIEYGCFEIYIVLNVFKSMNVTLISCKIQSVCVTWMR